MNQIKTKKLGNLFAIEISKIIHEEVKDKEVSFVTITGVDVTNDLSFAKVYCTTLNDDKKEEVLNALNRASNFIEIVLSKRVDVRKTPQISFHYDESIEYGNSIDKKIEEIKNKEK